MRRRSCVLASEDPELGVTHMNVNKRPNWSVTENAHHQQNRARPQLQTRG